jgi:adenine deaminase
MLEELIAAARGETPADLVLRNARLVNVLSGEIHPADIAIAGERVLGWGDYAGRESVDLAGRYVCPGFIDAHVHIESSMISPAQFARAVVPAGTTAVISDPHEIANVLGLDGIRYMLAASAGLPLDVYVMLPTCVPATPMETAGAALSAADLSQLRDADRVLGLGEMMNYPGVLFRAPAMLDMLRMIGAGRPVDGHAPGLTGSELNAYVAAGIRSDHESTTAAEAAEKLRAGMQILIREGTATRNLRALLEMVTPSNARCCSFCTDDRHPADLLDAGHVDDVVRGAIRAGLDPVLAIQIATLNTARHYQLWDQGAVAPGYRADLLVFDDLQDLRPAQVYKAGRLVAEGGRMLEGVRIPAAPPLHDTFDVAWELLTLNVPAPAGASELRVIGVIADQIVTSTLSRPARIEAGLAVADPARDLLKIAVIERHRGTGNAGIGFVEGFGLQRGAIASSVAHDSHNIVVVGASDAEMLLGAQRVAEMGGGQVVVAGEQVLAHLALPIAGLMSDQPVEAVRRQVDDLAHACLTLGATLPDPLMTMSFLALAVIPSLKLTDKGLVDVERFAVVPLWRE